jgi:hypothetical protein
MRAKITLRRTRRGPRQANEHRRPSERLVAEELKLIALMLDAIVATTITAQAALESTSVDIDSNVACCLRRNVSDRLREVMARVGKLFRAHGGSVPERLL